MKDYLKIINLMDLEELYCLIKNIIKENLKIVDTMDTVKKLIQMEKLYKVNGKNKYFKIELFIIIYYIYIFILINIF
jgi:hypothetical protein